MSSWSTFLVPESNLLQHQSIPYPAFHPANINHQPTNMIAQHSSTPFMTPNSSSASASPHQHSRRRSRTVEDISIPMFHRSSTQTHSPQHYAGKRRHEPSDTDSNQGNGKGIAEGFEGDAMQDNNVGSQFEIGTNDNRPNKKQCQHANPTLAPSALSAFPHAVPPQSLSVCPFPSAPPASSPLSFGSHNPSMLQQQQQFQHQQQQQHASTLTADQTRTLAHSQVDSHLHVPPPVASTDSASVSGSGFEGGASFNELNENPHVHPYGYSNQQFRPSSAPLQTQSLHRPVHSVVVASGVEMNSTSIPITYTGRATGSISLDPQSSSGEYFHSPPSSPIDASFYECDDDDPSHDVQHPSTPTPSTTWTQSLNDRTSTSLSPSRSSQTGTGGYSSMQFFPQSQMGNDHRTFGHALSSHPNSPFRSISTNGRPMSPTTGLGNGNGSGFTSTNISSQFSSHPPSQCPSLHYEYYVPHGVEVVEGILQMDKLIQQKPTLNGSNATNVNTNVGMDMEE